MFLKVNTRAGRVYNIKVRSSRGPQGPSGEVHVGTVTTIPHDQPASVENVGTGPNAVLNFEIPAGDPATNLVQSVNGKQGVVVLNATDVGADPTGSASQALADAKDYTDGEVSTLDSSLATVAKTGSYNDLSNKPTIPSIAGLATEAQVQDVQDNLDAHEADTANPHEVTKAQVGLSNVPNTDFTADVTANTAARHTHSNKATLDATTASFTTADESKLDGIETGAQVNTVTSVNTRTGAVTGLAEQSDLTAHTSNTSNPHEVTKAQVGLGNVDNTSDADKPISTSTQTALDTKATATALDAHTSNTSNPHSVTKAQVGLANVDNTSDMNKPVSTAQKTYVDTATNINPYRVPFRNSSTVGVANDFLSVDQVGASGHSLVRRTADGGVVVNNVNGASFYSGTGFPNGVVSAPVGSIYIDKNITNGASSWIKKSGTGNTGWQVLEGDTGWRDVGTLLINGWTATAGHFLIRRTGDVVNMISGASGGINPAAKTNQNFFAPPEGLRPLNLPQYQIMGIGFQSGSDVVHRIIRQNMIFQQASATAVISFNMTYQTTNTWPTTLPGVSA